MPKQMRGGLLLLLLFRVKFTIVPVAGSLYIFSFLLILLNKHQVRQKEISSILHAENTYVFYLKFWKFFVLIEEINLLACLMFLHTIICF